MDLVTIRATTLDPDFQARCVAAAQVEAASLLSGTYTGLAARLVMTGQVTGATLAALVCSDGVTDAAATDAAITARVVAAWDCLEKSC